MGKLSQLYGMRLLIDTNLLERRFFACLISAGIEKLCFWESFVEILLEKQVKSIFDVIRVNLADKQ